MKAPASIVCLMFTLVLAPGARAEDPPPAPTAEVTDEQLLAYLEPRIARYKWPKRFVRWAEMPKSGYGKIVKKQIRALLEERQEVA